MAGNHAVIRNYIVITQEPRPFDTVWALIPNRGRTFLIIYAKPQTNPDMTVPPVDCHVSFKKRLFTIYKPPSGFAMALRVHY